MNDVHIFCLSCTGTGHVQDDIDYPCFNCCGTGLKINVLFPLLYNLHKDARVHNSLKSISKVYLALCSVLDGFQDHMSQELADQLTSYEKELLYKSYSSKDENNDNLYSLKKLFVTEYSYVKLLLSNLSEKEIPFNLIILLMNNSNKEFNRIGLEYLSKKKDIGEVPLELIKALLNNTEKVFQEKGVEFLLKDRNKEYFNFLLSGLCLDDKGKIDYSADFGGDKFFQCKKCNGKGVLYSEYDSDYWSDCEECSNARVNIKLLYDIFEQVPEELSLFKEFSFEDIIINEAARIFYEPTDSQGGIIGFLDYEDEAILETYQSLGESLIKKSENRTNAYLKIVKLNVDTFKNLPKDVRENKAIVLAATEQSSSSFKYASKELRSDKEIVSEVVKNNGYALQYASEELRCDKNIVIEALKKTGDSFQYASESLRSDKDFVIEAVKQNGYALKYASKELRSDKELVMNAVSKSGSALEFVSENLRSDRELVLKAISRNGYAIRYASDELKNDKDLAIIALITNVNAIKGVSERLKADKELIYINSIWHGQESSPDLSNCEKKNVLKSIKKLFVGHVKEILTGEILQDMNEFSEAIECFKTAYKLKPTARPVCQMAKCYEALNKKEIAYKHFLEAAVIRKNRLGKNDHRTKIAVNDAVRLSNDLGCTENNPSWFNQIENEIPNDDDLPF